MPTQPVGGNGRDQNTCRNPETAADDPTVLPTAALCASLVQNHPFVDGNKRVGHAAMATFLLLNGFDITATTDEQEALILDLAAGRRRREDLAAWPGFRITPRSYTIVKTRARAERLRRTVNRDG